MNPSGAPSLFGHDDAATDDGDGGGVRTQQYAAEFVLKLLKKRMLSSPAAFAERQAKDIVTWTQDMKDVGYQPE